MAQWVKLFKKQVMVCALTTLSLGAAEADSKLLISSIQNKDMKGIEIALKRGADVDYISKSQYSSTTPLGVAFNQLHDKENPLEIEKTHKIIEILLKKKATIPTDQNSLFPVFCYGSKKIVSILLMHGLNPHLKLYGYTTAEFVIKHENTELLPLLYARNVAKVTPEERIQLELIAGAHRYDMDKMRKAIESGAKVNQYDPGGETALCISLGMPLRDFACKNVIDLVLGYKADPNLPTKASDGYGNYPLHLVSSSSFGQPNIENMLLTVRLLIENGAEVNARNEFKETPLHSAAKANLTQIVKVLLKNGADPKAKDFRGREPGAVTSSLEIQNLLYAATKP